MKNILKMIGSGFVLIRRDPMLVLLLFAPWMASAVLWIALPLLAPLLQSALHFDLTQWYPLTDMLILMLAPMMAGMLTGFLILDERDEGVGVYYAVTPLGGMGYYFSRLCLPVLYAVLVTPILMALFSLSHPAVWRVLAIAVIGGIFASSTALLLQVFAGNKVEGLAVSKMMGLLMLPVFVPFFTGSPWGMVTGVLPPYWMGVLAKGSPLLIVPGFAISGLWLTVMYRMTQRR